MATIIASVYYNGSSFVEMAEKIYYGFKAAGVDMASGVPCFTVWDDSAVFIPLEALPGSPMHSDIVSEVTEGMVAGKRYVFFVGDSMEILVEIVNGYVQ